MERVEADTYRGVGFGFGFGALDPEAVPLQAGQGQPFLWSAMNITSFHGTMRSIRQDFSLLIVVKTGF